MIELIVFDIDGVITDGSVIIDSNGKEQKQINLKDIDAIFECTAEDLTDGNYKEDTERYYREDPLGHFYLCVRSYHK